MGRSVKMLAMMAAVAAWMPAAAQPAAMAAETLPQPAPVAGYRIVRRDLLDVRVFNEPELSVTQLPVDIAGNVSLPLIGDIAAAGKRTSELSDEVRAKLARYVINPRVTVMVMEPAARQFTVDGQVTQPGLYDLPMVPTLTSSLAQARGLTRVAKQSQVVILRELDGHRYAARFDVAAIRKGKAADPEVMANDKIFVGLSAGKAVVRDLLSVAPLLTAVFVRLD